MFVVVVVCLTFLLLLLCFENRGFIYVHVSDGNKTFARWAIGADPGSSPALIMPTPTCTSVCGGALRALGGGCAALCGQGFCRQAEWQRQWKGGGAPQQQGGCQSSPLAAPRRRPSRKSELAWGEQSSSLGGPFALGATPPSRWGPAI